MSTCETSQPIALSQLATELGTDALSMSDNGEARTITCHDETVTQEQLEAAVEAHVPAPPPMTPEEQISSLQQEVADKQMQIDDLADFVFATILGGI